MASTDENAAHVLSYLATHRDRYVEGEELAKNLRLTPDAVNDAVALLIDRRLAEWERVFGSAPYDFGYVTVTPRGRYEAELAGASRERVPEFDVSPPRGSVKAKRGSVKVKRACSGQARTPNAKPTRTRPSTTLPRRTPEGSPYGFTEQD